MEEFIFYIIKLNLFVGGAVAAACILDRFLRRKYSVRWRYILWLCIAALLLVPVDLSKSYAMWKVQIPVQHLEREYKVKIHAVEFVTNNKNNKPITYKTPPKY